MIAASREGSTITDQPQEAISQAAIKVDGKVFTGNTHADAVLAAQDHFKLPDDKFWDLLNDQHDGFITNTGRYVSRGEAMNIAQASGQASPAMKFGTLGSEHLKFLTPQGAQPTPMQTAMAQPAPQAPPTAPPAAAPPWASTAAGSLPWLWPMMGLAQQQDTGRSIPQIAQGHGGLGLIDRLLNYTRGQ